jgi:DNA-binding IclR family transcriptional regulator
MSKTTKPTIQSIQKAMTIMSAFTVNKPRLTLNELTEALGSTKATAHRYTMALREARLVRYSERDTLFSLGPQVLTLAAATRAGIPVIAAAAPLMRDLVKEFDQTLVLSIWDGASPVVVHVDDDTDAVVRVGIRTGSRLDLEHSAQGRVLCAFIPPEREQAVADALAHSEELREHVAKIRRTGVAINTEADTGIRAVAVPVMVGDFPAAALAVVGTTVAIADDRLPAFGERLREIADVISADLVASAWTNAD